MQTKQLGSTDMHLTPLGMGTWAIGGGGWVGGWGSQDDAESIATIHKALDLGINWIDTAAAYGLGHSEEVVARALKGRSNKPYVFTKCSTVWNEKREVSNTLKADSLRKEIENSLRRLQTDVIDLYQIHWPNPDEEVEEGWSTLAQFKKEGKVRYIGVSNFNVDQMRRAQKIAPISSLQPPYSLIKRDIEQDILPFCQEHNIGVIVYSPMQSGLLTGAINADFVQKLPEDDWRRNSPEFNEPRLSRNLKLVDLLREIGKSHDRSPGEAAIAWVLRHPAVTAAIVGGRHPYQVERNSGAADFRLNQDEIEQIESFVKANP
jgi:aryl-alcohol dehydrogenase-like predicted oxidoreductase